MKHALFISNTFGKASLRLFRSQCVKLFLIFSVLAVFSNPPVCEADTKAMLEKAGGSIVSIASRDREGNPVHLGDGFIVGDGTFIVTSYHIVNGRRDLVIVKDNREFEVEARLYEDRQNDIIVLKAASIKLMPVTLGDSDRASEGEKVYIATVQERTTAFVEGILHKIHAIGFKRRLFLISMPVPGKQSGSPVLNSSGNVIGITSPLIEDEKNLSFAFPLTSLRAFLSVHNADAGIDHVTQSDYTETAEYWFNRGSAYESLGRYQEATGAFMDAARLSPDAPEIPYHLGIVYEKSGIYGLAVQEYRKAAALRSDDADIHYRLGVAYTKLGVPDKAADSFKEAIRYRPDFARAYSSLGFAYFKSGSYHESLEASLQAVQLDPGDAVGHYGLGVAYSQMNMTKEAINAFKKAVDLNPDNAEAHFALGALCILDERDTALKEYEILKKLDPEYANELLRLLSVPAPAETYSVQVGAFAVKSNATALTEKLKQKGYDVFISEETPSGGKKLYRVLVGKFGDRESARNVASAITGKEGIGSFIIRHEP